jgi:hypothetical protein
MAAAAAAAAIPIIAAAAAFKNDAHRILYNTIFEILNALGIENAASHADTRTYPATKSVKIKNNSVPKPLSGAKEPFSIWNTMVTKVVLDIRTIYTKPNRKIINAPIIYNLLASVAYYLLTITIIIPHLHIPIKQNTPVATAIKLLSQPQKQKTYHQQHTQQSIADLFTSVANTTNAQQGHGGAKSPPVHGGYGGAKSPPTIFTCSY